MTLGAPTKIAELKDAVRIRNAKYAARFGAKAFPMEKTKNPIEQAMKGYRELLVHCRDCDIIIRIIIKRCFLTHLRPPSRVIGPQKSA
jgi:hypothetical protein